MKKWVVIVLMMVGSVVLAKQQSYDMDDYWFDYQVVHSSEAPQSWTEALNVRPSDKKYFIKLAVRHNDGSQVSWSIKKNKIDEWLTTQDPFGHSRIQVYRQMTDETGKPFVVGLLWADPGKEVAIHVSSVIDESYRISATLPFQANHR